jgi:hypothetical protein
MKVEKVGDVGHIFKISTFCHKIIIIPYKTFSKFEFTLISRCGLDSVRGMQYGCTIYGISIEPVNSQL